MSYRPGDSVLPKVDYIDRTVNPLEVPPEVSIILPAYNAHNTIKRTIASICMQENVDEIEIIIADDCSDQPYDHIAALFAHMVRIKVVRMLKNGGPGAARQVGYDYSCGKYVMWMDADDTLVGADSITTLKNVMIQKDMDCVYGRFLEQNEDGSIYPHELHMVWMFGKLYRREFLEKYKIRFNTSLSNEDTGFNCVVKGCTDKVWYIPKDVYIWHFKANSITRIKQGMYGQDSGYKGYLDNMVWQILELQKRFVNKNYILSEIVSIMCVLYHFHVENMQHCPLNTDVSMNWIRGYYDLVYKPYEDLITEDMFMRTFAQVAAGQNIASKGIVPKLTIYEFMDKVRAEPYKTDINEEIRGSTPAGYIPPITDPNWPVEVSEYIDMVESSVNVDSDTNFSRYGGMKRVLGIPTTDKDYDIHYDGSDGKSTDNIDMIKEEYDRNNLNESEYQTEIPRNYYGTPDDGKTDHAITEMKHDECNCSCGTECNGSCSCESEQYGICETGCSPYTTMATPTTNTTKVEPIKEVTTSSKFAHYTPTTKTQK